MTARCICNSSVISRLQHPREESDSIPDYNLSHTVRKKTKYFLTMILIFIFLKDYVICRCIVHVGSGLSLPIFTSQHQFLVG